MEVPLPNTYLLIHAQLRAFETKTNHLFTGTLKNKDSTLTWRIEA